MHEPLNLKPKPVLNSDTGLIFFSTDPLDNLTRMSNLYRISHLYRISTPSKNGVYDSADK